ncbi:hypothetical protein J7T55_014661 [Diaporthe amygdali]|uniref:uncharacterized protein n=1 Tax=Phomopsis amygdali TaxID=1214568 RepID=UPI0022FE0241|nr:uncharacterized protein J7T55_014661 [Diaporthe amygdali]KAJ0107131.1 hypothetical protein J7T55_014661 [Diaporthe amygdali]
MAKDKRSRSRKPSGKLESASRAVSTDSAIQDSSPSPSSTPATEASSEQAQVDPTDGNEEPSHINLADELEAAGLDSSDEDSKVYGTQESQPSSAPHVDNVSEEISGSQRSGVEGQNEEPRGTGPGQQPTQNKEDGEAPDSNSVRPGRSEVEYQEELSKRFAAEETVSKLQAEAEADRKRYEDDAKAERADFERRIRRLQQEKEGEKLKYESKFDDKDGKIQEFQEQIQKHTDNVQKLTTALEECQKSLAGDDAGAGEHRGDRGDENEQYTLRGALQRELDASMGGLPSPRNGLRPGSARFLLAEHEYLLDKNSQLYEAVLATANYADGRGSWTSDEDKRLVDAFRVAVAEMNEFLEKNVDRAVDCVVESKNDWALSAKENGW